jgi:hypothetical protein
MHGENEKSVRTYGKETWRGTGHLEGLVVTGLIALIVVMNPWVP